MCVLTWTVWTRHYYRHVYLCIPVWDRARNGACARSFTARNTLSVVFISMHIGTSSARMVRRVFRPVSLSAHKRTSAGMCFRISTRSESTRAERSCRTSRRCCSSARWGRGEGMTDGRRRAQWLAQWCNLQETVFFLNSVRMQLATTTCRNGRLDPPSSERCGNSQIVWWMHESRHGVAWCDVVCAARWRCPKYLTMLGENCNISCVHTHSMCVVCAVWEPQQPLKIKIR